MYKRFPDKVIQDTYTPQGLKLQILLIFGTIFLLLLSTFEYSAAYLAALALAGFLLASLPFWWFAVRRDAKVAFLSPFYLPMRALVIGSGVIYFALKQVGQVRRN